MFAYDSRGRIDTVTAGSRTWTYAYASSGYLQTVQGPEGSSASYSTDANGRVTTATLPGSRQVGFSYDVRGNLVSLTPPGRGAHGFEYTDGGKVSRIVPPAIAGVDGDTEFAYDSDGAVTSITRPGGEVVDVDYDAAGRPATISDDDGDVSFSYHATGAGKGRLNTVTAQNGQSVAFSYDGPLVTSVTSSGGSDGTLTYDYNADLQPASSSLNGANTVGYAYDSDGLLSNAGALSISREPTTGRTSGTQLGAVSTSRTFTTAGLLETSSSTASGSSLLGSSYGYDGLDRITTKTETTPAGSAGYGYQYDAAGRIEEATKDGQVWRQYTYDANGNRTSDRKAGQLAVTSTYDAQDRLISRGSETFSYTDAGELASRTDTSTSQTTSYHYSARGLTGADLPDGTQVTYKLDGFGRRVAVSHDGQVIRRYVYGIEASAPVAELNPDNTVHTRFVYGTRSYVPDYMVRDGVTYRLIADELGSVRRVVDTGTGAVVQAIDYDPYGVVLSDSQPGFQPFGYAGGQHDPDTGLVQFGARDYDPTLGRWTSKDPIGFAGGDTNLYAYVNGDPINGVDPSGLLFDTIGDLWDASTEAAAAATAYWADQSVNSDSSIVRGLATGAGLLSSLWACGNATSTAMTLLPYGRAAQLIGKATSRLGPFLKGLGPRLADETGSVGIFPRRFRTTKNFDEVASRLGRFHGIDRALASERLHSIKHSAGHGGADNVVFDMTGNVYHSRTGELLGSLTAGGGRGARP